MLRIFCNSFPAPYCRRPSFSLSWSRGYQGARDASLGWSKAGALSASPAGWPKLPSPVETDIREGSRMWGEEGSQTLAAKGAVFSGLLVPPHPAAVRGLGKVPGTHFHKSEASSVLRFQKPVVPKAGLPGKASTR